MKRVLFVMLLLSSLCLGQQVLTLDKVTQFDDLATGVAGSKSGNYLAFEAEVERGDKAAPLFEELLKSGPPAARLYAAVGLWNLDKARGKAALESLTADTSEVDRMSGCMVMRTTVGATAKEILKDGSAVYYIPAESRK